MKGTEWPGGYIRIGKGGRKTYMIRRQVAGVRYHVSTRCSTLRAAMKELERFEADPPGYRPGADPDGAIYLDPELAAAFLRDHSGNSRGWRVTQRTLIAWWAEQLAGVDLRRATLRDHILPALEREGVGSRRHRIAVIKRLYAWLRERDRISLAEDPVVGKLKPPSTRVAQLERSKVISRDQYEAARAHMVGIYRDGLDVLAGTGWHLTELERFASGGRIEPYAGPDPEGAGILVVLHKGGVPHRTLVTAPVLEAAERIRARGSFSVSGLHKAVRAACAAAGVPRFSPGQFRHTIATLATEAGYDLQVSRFLGHRSATTTRRHYATLATPPRVPTLL